MIQVRATDAGHAVLHDDGTTLFVGDQVEATFRAALYSQLAKRRGGEITGGLLSKLWPANAPQPLVLTALAAELAGGIPQTTFEVDGEATFKGETERTFTIKHYEVLRAGTVLKLTSAGWAKFSITDADVLGIVEAFHELKWEPPFKIGHNRKQPELDGLPSIGRAFDVRAVEVDGTDGQGPVMALFADFKRVPERVVDAMRGGSLYQVSVEFFPGMVPRPVGDGVYPRVLKAVSLLGEDLPAVRGMRPADEMVPAFATGAHDTEIVTQYTEEPAPMSEQPKPKSDPEMLTVDKTKWEEMQRALESVPSQLEALKAEIKARDEALAKIQTRHIEDSAKSFVELAVKEGHITPAAESYALAVLRSLDDEPEVVTFTTVDKDGKPSSTKHSRFDAFKAFVRSLPKQPGAPGSDPVSRGSRTERPELTGFAALSLEDQSAAIAAETDKRFSALPTPEQTAPAYARISREVETEMKKGGN